MAQSTTNFQKAIGIIAGITGLVQGLIWSALSIVCILCYADDMFKPRNPNIDDIITQIYYLFLNNSQKIGDEKYLYPQGFLIFICFLLVLSIAWTFLSGDLLWSSLHHKWDRSKSLYLGWPIVTIGISIIDLVFVFLLTVDVTDTVDYRNAYYLVIAVVSRGGLIWILNLTLAGIILNFLQFQIDTHNKPVGNQFINGYQNSARNFTNDDLWIPNAQIMAYSAYENPALSRDEGILTNSNTPQKLATNEVIYANPKPNYPNLNRNPSVAMNAASSAPELRYGAFSAPEPSPKIAVKPIPRPILLGGPVIPDPDYTPPGSPTSKSILRSKSNY